MGETFSPLDNTWGHKHEQEDPESSSHGLPQLFAPPVSRCPGLPRQLRKGGGARPLRGRGGAWASLSDGAAAMATGAGRDWTLASTLGTREQRGTGRFIPIRPP